MRGRIYLGIHSGNSPGLIPVPLKHWYQLYNCQMGKVDKQVQGSWMMKQFEVFHLEN